MALARRALTAVALASSVAAVVAGCGTRQASDPAGGSASQPNSGIRGRVLLGPTCPAGPAGKTCVRAYQATIVIRAKPGARQLARVRSSAAGRFSVALAPGRYVLEPQNGRPYPTSVPETVAVQAHRYTNVIVRYDTGMR